MAAAPIPGMTVAAAIDVTPGGRSDTGTRQTQAGTPGKSQSTLLTGSLPSSTIAGGAQSFRSSWQSVLAALGAGTNLGDGQGAGANDSGASAPAGLEIDRMKAAGKGSTAPGAVAATALDATGSGQGPSSARFAASRSAAVANPQPTASLAENAFSKAHPSESVQDARSSGPTRNTRVEKASETLPPVPPENSYGLSCTVISIPILAEPTRPAPHPGTPPPTGSQVDPGRPDAAEGSAVLAPLAPGASGAAMNRLGKEASSYPSRSSTAPANSISDSSDAKQAPAQIRQRDNTPSPSPSQALSETVEPEASGRPSVLSQLPDSQLETAQPHPTHPAALLPAGVVPASASSSPAPAPASSDLIQPAPITAIPDEAQAIESKFPATTSAGAGSTRTATEASWRSAHGTSSGQSVPQANPLHGAQPGVPAQEAPSVAPVRDSAAMGATTSEGSGLASSTTNSGGSPGDTFAAIDGGIATGSHTWIHAGAQRAEAGFQDPNLGWIGVRADTSGGGIHAALIPGSADASLALGGHMAGLNTYLADRHTPVDSLTLAEFDSRSAGSGAGRQGSETMHQGAGREDGQGAYSEAQPSSRTGTAAIATAASSEHTPQATGADSTYDTRKPGGAHISVIA